MKTCPACGAFGQKGATVCSVCNTELIGPGDSADLMDALLYDEDEEDTAEPVVDVQSVKALAATMGSSTEPEEDREPTVDEALEGLEALLPTLDPMGADESGELPVVDPSLPVLEPVSSAPAAADPERMQQWLQLLDASPVFAGTEDATPMQRTEQQPVLTMDPIELQIGMQARYDYASVPSAGGQVARVLVNLSPSGAPLVNPEVQTVAHVILALDLSASMNHMDKYPVLTKALTQMIYDLQAPGNGDVMVSVVAFAYGAEVLLKEVPASQLDPRELIMLLDGSDLRFTRYTDIVGALSRAGRIAYDHVRRDKVTPVRIYVLTDGKPQDELGARKVMNQIQKMPVDVSALCFGADADVESMQKLVSGGRGGTVKHVRSSTIEEAFGRIAEVATRVLATRCIFDLELGAGVVGGRAYRFRPGRHAYGEDAFVDGRHFKTDLGTLEQGRTYSMFFEIMLPRTMQAETEIGKLTLKVPGFGGPRVFEQQLKVGRHVGSSLPDPDPVVVEAQQVLAALESKDPVATLDALHARRRIYEQERRDPQLIAVLDKAIQELQDKGSLEDLSKEDRAALMAHTVTVNVGKPLVAAEIVAAAQADARAQAQSS